MFDIFKVDRSAAGASGTSSVHNLSKAGRNGTLIKIPGQGEQSTSMAAEGPSGLDANHIEFSGSRTPKKEDVPDGDKTKVGEGGNNKAGDNPIEADKDEEIRKAAWKEMIAALKKAREEKQEKDRLEAEKQAAGLGSLPAEHNQLTEPKMATLK